MKIDDRLTNALRRDIRTIAPGYLVRKNCDYLLTMFIEAGVKQLRAEGKLEDPTSIAKMKQNLARFVLAMVKEADRRGLHELQEPTFEAARAKLCPLWPFC